MEQEIVALINQLPVIDIFGLLVKFVIAFYLLMLLKNLITSIKDYTILRADKDISLNAPVRYGNFEGTIKNIGLFSVTISSEEGYIKVPNSSWLKYGTPIYLYPEVHFSKKVKCD